MSDKKINIYILLLFQQVEPKTQYVLTIVERLRRRCVDDDSSSKELFNCAKDSVCPSFNGQLADRGVDSHWMEPEACFTEDN